ncbi:hypothetical protein A2276_05645 [candidate division WOR-1 bacterium RIFOXYA12_FULL_43_27]|uniref:Uncharacterized protein n=1 Tax=candidate division WOR-1 bacterium RIFOXYC2_FULL_46_14 TaxID=1802587 RepID=A0A1F4U3G8_UNCSA|nr:MAG: hypothetical protein A2276_05645 [candidate division WOR-1 bacterium RIFOXYA12_FULL_43_27]OGC20149.1 MAG: hypothetical protein A2292_03650 [candidate division WOR-1 bacterium RIFOXYB2_FULL_46_45]OGC32114.1 MAG: hypothetical protein A2232_07800 [candidate division WOR-1 bacterium RIFOXYA2_FULL_46_56]OGC39515.1 MAG: hypothetical protein A2438_08165 [candidate division WOR-1 bacterium RIFOXYC2_FULL_46_14]
MLSSSSEKLGSSDEGGKVLRTLIETLSAGGAVKGAVAPNQEIAQVSEGQIQGQGRGTVV